MLYALPLLFIFLINLFIYLFIYFWLCWVFVSVQGLSPVAERGGHPSSRCVGLSLSRPLLLRSTGSRRAGSVVVAHGHSCSVACGILPDRGTNPCPLHWQADSQPLRHQGSPLPLLWLCSGNSSFKLFDMLFLQEISLCKVTLLCNFSVWLISLPSGKNLNEWSMLIWAFLNTDVFRRHNSEC